MNKAPHLCIIVAGTNDPSNSQYLAETFREGAKMAGVESTILRLKNMRVDHFDLACYEKDNTTSDDFQTIRTCIESSSGVVIASPIWNFSVPAHLKNLIDRMGSFGLDRETHSKGTLNAKPFFLLYTGGAPMIAWKALMYLTTLHITEAIRYYGGTVVGKHFEPKCVVGRGIFGLVVDRRPQTIRSVRSKGRHFAAIAKHYAEAGTLPIRLRISYRVFSFLQRVANRIMYPIAR